MTREEVIAEIVKDNLASIIQLAQNGDYADLEVWLTPIFEADLEKQSDADLYALLSSLKGDVMNEEEEME